MIDLMTALEKHKRAIGSLLHDGNYGNCNYEVHAMDKVYLQGWLNFLSLQCFDDSLEAKEAIWLIKSCAD